MKKEEEIYKDIGKKVRVVLPNNIYYSGKVIFEDKDFVILIDKFGFEVRLTKKNIISFEVQNGN